MHGATIKIIRKYESVNLIFFFSKFTYLLTPWSRVLLKKLFGS